MYSTSNFLVLMSLDSATAQVGDPIDGNPKEVPLTWPSIPVDVALEVLEVVVVVELK